jgi:small subunit ribosomal protein S20
VANSPQAKKRARQAEKRRTHNSSLRSLVRTNIKKINAAIDSGSAEDAKAAYDNAIPVIDRMADKGIIHNVSSTHSRKSRPCAGFFVPQSSLEPFHTTVLSHAVCNSPQSAWLTFRDTQKRRPWQLGRGHPWPRTVSKGQPCALRLTLLYKSGNRLQAEHLLIYKIKLKILKGLEGVGR